MKSTQAMALGLVLTMLIPGAPRIAAAEGIAEPVPGTSISPSIESPADGDGQDASNIDLLFGLYKNAVENGEASESVILAKKVVTASIENYGLDSKVTAVALTNLAMLQTTRDENVSAIQNFHAAIDIVEGLESRLSEELIMVLKGLGRAEIQAGNLDRARVALYRALHISHVNYGPHNYEQIETLYTIANLLHDAGLPEEAYKIRKRITYLYTRNAAVRHEDGMLPSI